MTNLNRKLKKLIVLSCTCILGGLLLAGCSNLSNEISYDLSKDPEEYLANEIRLPMKNITKLTFAYTADDITFFIGESDELVVKEYMSENKSSYYADVNQSKDSIHIKGSDEPNGNFNFSRDIEVYLPAAYQHNLNILTTSGDIEFSNIENNLKLLHIDSTSGEIQLDKITAADATITTTSGDIECNALSGKVKCETTSGDLDILSAIGSGIFKTQSGDADIQYTKVDGNLDISATSGDVDLTLPKDLSFILEATSNAEITTPYPQDVYSNDESTIGKIGKNPTLTIKLETTSGDIAIEE